MGPRGLTVCCGYAGGARAPARRVAGSWTDSLGPTRKSLGVLPGIKEGELKQQIFRVGFAKLDLLMK